MYRLFIQGIMVCTRLYYHGLSGVPDVYARGRWTTKLFKFYALRQEISNRGDHTSKHLRLIKTRRQACRNTLQNIPKTKFKQFLIPELRFLSEYHVNPVLCITAKSLDIFSRGSAYSTS